MELKLIKQLPKRENVLMKTTPTGTYEPPDITTYAWVINYWLIKHTCFVTIDEH